ncbi:MAG: hypothetical protein ACR2GR_04700 [Rhodothermales bacterium]
MIEGHHLADGDDAYPWLDEFLCEYADGTMDPSIQKVFEEYLLANPQLADHAEQLRCTHQLLCLHGCRLRAPEGLQARVRQRLSCEMMQAQRGPFTKATLHLGTLTLFASVTVVMLVAGMLVGPVLFPPPSDSPLTHSAPPLQRQAQPATLSPHSASAVHIRPADQAHYHSASHFDSASIARSLTRQHALQTQAFQAPDTLLRAVVSNP